MAARHTMVQHHTLHACSTILAPPGKGAPSPSSITRSPTCEWYISSLCTDRKARVAELGRATRARAPQARPLAPPAVPLTSRITGAPYGGEVDVLASATLS